MVKREAGVCYLQNDETVITHYQTKQVMQYPCAAQDPEHNHLYWSGDFDRVGDSFSPANDAIFAAQVLKEFYKIWYNVPVLVNKNGTPMVLQMNVHVAKLDNAFWDGESMTFGDGRELYPLTSLGIAAHEVSHGFTQQHSNLTYDGQSGGMNEAFSDMAAQTAEYYAHKKNSWQIGGEIFKIEGESMRYMDQPSKDCYGKEPGTFCSIDSADQYYAGLNVHYSSGVYNRAFYVLSNMPDWNPRKAFAVMLQANASYWLPQTQYADGAACVVKAAEDLDFDKKAVEQAFKTVGIRVPENCTNRAI
jgi:pseudolysin